LLLKEKKINPGVNEIEFKQEKTETKKQKIKISKNQEKRVKKKTENKIK